MNILLIPPKDWVHHPFRNRLNFIFDAIAKTNNVYILGFSFPTFQKNDPLPTRCTVIPADWYPLHDLSAHYIINSPSHLKTILNIVRDRHIDVIVTANILPAWLARFTGVPVVVDYLDHFCESAAVYYSNRPMIYKAVKYCTNTIITSNLEHAKHIITVTPELKHELQNIIGHDKPITVISNGVDLSLLSMQPKRSNLRPILGFIGSIEPWVDFETPIYSSSALNVDIHIYGPQLFTNFKYDLINKVHNLGLDKNVHFFDAVPYENAGAIIGTFDIGLNCLQPMDKNIYSAGGKVFMYLASGRPVLSSEVVSLRQMFKDGISYYHDIPSFIQTVRTLLKNPQEPTYLRSLVEPYDWELLAKQYYSVLAYVVGETIRY